MAKYFTYKDQEFSVGDTVAAAFIVTEGDKTRQQIFEGIIMAVDNKESGKCFRIRKIAVGSIGVERIVPLASPGLASLKIITKGDVRRAKLYYMRDRIGKQAMKIKKDVQRSEQVKTV